jgi:hypothetical protein
MAEPALGWQASGWPLALRINGLPTWRESWELRIPATGCGRIREPDDGNGQVFGRIVSLPPQERRIKTQLPMKREANVRPMASPLDKEWS